MPALTAQAAERQIQRFCINATFNAEPLGAVFEFWAKFLGAAFDVAFAPCNQTLQTLLDLSSIFSLNRDGINVLLVRWEDLGQFELYGDAALAQMEANAQELLRAVRGGSPDMAVPLIFCICPPSPAFAENQRPFLNRLNNRAMATLEGVPSAQLLDYRAIAHTYPVKRWDNPRGHTLGSVPYTDLYFAALGTAIVRLSVALIAPPYKVIALDCDNTLWKGICGEDGPDGVVLDEARRDLQRFMLEEYEAGMLLCLASKNNEADVLETFKRKPEMPLQLSRFAARRINWERKADSLAALSLELGVGLDSFILVDDNRVECGAVENTLPEVLSLTLPDQAGEIPEFLRHVWAFDHPVVTEEDLHRNSYYTQTQEFGIAIRSTPNLQHFYDTLNLQVAVKPLKVEHLNRAAQLTQRSNQFNTTTIRRTEAEIQKLTEAGCLCLVVEASDRFGEYGVIGLVILEPCTTNLFVDTFLLSCRVLGRGVEHRILRELGRTASARGLAAVTIPLYPTSRNLPATQFLESIGAEWREPGESGFLFRIPAVVAANVKWSLGSASHPSAANPMPHSSKMRRRFIDYNRIASALNTAEHVLKEMRLAGFSARRPAPSSNGRDLESRGGRSVRSPANRTRRYQPLSGRSPLSDTIH
jgi:FkbH-like protein